jgi:hypothetical protein
MLDRYSSVTTIVAGCTLIEHRAACGFCALHHKLISQGILMLGGLMQSSFSVGQFVRFRKVSGRIYEIIRILPLEDEGTTLYLIRNTQGAEAIARHSEIERA